MRYQYLLVRSEERWVSLHHCFVVFFRFFFFFGETYVIFMLLLLYIIFFILEYLMDMCLLCVDVGLMRHVDYARNMRRPQPGAAPAAAGGPTAVGDLPVGEVERVLR
jgi:hypothetical protein